MEMSTKVFFLALASSVFLLPELAQAQAVDQNLFNPDYITRAGAYCEALSADGATYYCTVFIESAKESDPIIHLTSDVQYGKSWEHPLTKSFQWAQDRAKSITQQFHVAIDAARSQRKMLHIGVADGYQTIINFDKYLYMTNVPKQERRSEIKFDEFDVRMRGIRDSNLEVRTTIGIEESQ